MKNQPESSIFKKDKLFNAIWAVMSKLFSGLKLVAVGVIVARSLGPEDFGAFNYAISFVTLLAVIAEFRLHNILIREISEEKESSAIILGSAFYSCLFLSILGYLCLSLLTVMFEEDKRLQMLILVFGVSYFFQTLRFLRAFFIAKLKNNYIFFIEIGAAVLVVLLAFLMAFFELSILYFILLRVFDVFFISSLLIVLYQIIYKGASDWRFNKIVSKRILKSSSPLVISSLALVIFQQFDKIMIKQLLNEYSVGQYSASVSIISLIAFIPVVLTEAISPYLIKTKMGKGVAFYKRDTQLFSDYIIWGSALVCLCIMLFSSTIITLVYGEEYLEAIAVMKVFAWQGVLIAMGSMAAQIMIIDDTHQIAYLKSISGGILNIVLNLIWIPKYGIMGAVYASLAAYGMSSFLAHFIIKRYRYIFFIQIKSITHGLGNIFADLKSLNKGKQNNVQN